MDAMVSRYTPLTSRIGQRNFSCIQDSHVLVVGNTVFLYAPLVGIYYSDMKVLVALAAKS